MMIIIFIFLLLEVFLLIAITFNAGRCCGDCKNYEKCYGDSQDKNTYDYSACNKFKEIK